MLYKIKKDNRFGFINELGDVVVKPSYELVFDFKYDCCVVREKVGYGLIDKQGNELLPCQYDFIQQVAKDVLVISSKQGKALMNQTGKFLTEPVYGGIFDFSDGLAMAYKGLKFGYLNIKGEECISFEFDFAEKFKEGYAMVLKENKYSLMNQHGEFENAWKFDFYSIYENGYSVNLGGKRVEDDCVGGKYGLLSNKNKLLTKIEFDFIDRFVDGRAIVQKDKFFGEIDEMGKIITSIIHKEPVYKKEEYPVFKKENKYGLMDADGKELIPAQYDELVVYPAHRLCWAKENNLFGVLTFDNNFILKPSLDLQTIYSMNEGYVHVELKNRKHGLISTVDGIWLLPPVYDSIGVFKGSLVELERDGKQFYANRKGEIVWGE